ncbi:class I SAM-dependent methyltransferase [Planktotalea sp.]|uniref:class I SAM-dependent methyltransferase n=1 Tax=Planktotalea sp. TaxID=2029877 RepID=UPI003297DB7B
MWKHARLELARDANLLPPLDGAIGVLGQIAVERLRGLDDLQLQCESNSFVATTALRSAGYKVVVEQDASFEHAVVFLPRAKAEAQHLIAHAIERAPNGWIVLDGQKTDGIESIVKQVARSVAIEGSFSKGHGKTVWFRAADAQDLLAWRAEPTDVDGGFSTAPGVFSADGIDPASAMLIPHLPDDMRGAVVDLGAGWGFLSAKLLSNAPKISRLHLVEDNKTALDCARSNVQDARAEFHWADALSWNLREPVHTVIMNPPFHTARNAEPSLGIGFINAAAKLLKPGGKLYMVANAHLPYEPTLEAAFSKVDVLERSTRFKVFCAEQRRGKVR